MEREGRGTFVGEDQKSLVEGSCVNISVSHTPTAICVSTQRHGSGSTGCSGAAAPPLAAILYVLANTGTQQEVISLPQRHKSQFFHLLFGIWWLHFFFFWFSCYQQQLLLCKYERVVQHDLSSQSYLNP